MTGRVRTQKRYVSCHTHLDMSVSRVSLTVLGNYARFFVSYESIKRELKIIVYYESIKEELKIKPIYECRCDERLQTKTKRFIAY
jgi:hypothetical protein